MIGLLISILVLAISLLIISKLPLGIDIDNPGAALFAGAIIGLLNGIWYAFPQFIRTASWLFTLGIVPLLGSVIVFGLSALLTQGFRLRWGIGSAILGAIALA
ncbi:MAG: phage holin family protein, partial [Cyanobacteriota bacterium]